MIDVRARRRSNPSPLRYPGGKAPLASFFEDTIRALGLVKPTYVEPYAGGAGAGLDLLYRGVVGRVVINDFDYSVYSLWDSMLHRHDEFLDRFDSAPLTVDEWKRQREIYRRRDEPGLDKLDLGFATFYLNRTNRSGVLRGGMIGGLKQEGKYKLDARFNKETLRERIEAAYASSSVVSILPDEVVPELSRVQGTDGAEIGVFSDRATGRAIVVSALDNLGKGAAGQAVQNANLALGLDETAGLRLSGVLV